MPNAYTEIPILKRTHKAGGTITADTFVKTSAAAVTCGAGEHALGVAKADASSGDLVPVDVLGDTVVISGAAVSADVLIASDAAGKAVTAAGAGTFVLGKALTASTGANQKILIQLFANGVAHA